MPRRRLTVHLVALSLGAAAVGTGAMAAPAQGAVEAASTSHITIVLAAPDAAGLDRLVAAHGLTHAQRVAAVSRLVPSEATHALVAAELRTEHLTVTSETAWTISATAPAGVIATHFGTRPVLGTRPSRSRYLQATGPLPRVPSALDRVVSAVFPTKGGPAPFHHAATSSLNGRDFRRADAPAGTTESTGQRSAGTTVATVQFADFYGPGDPDPSRTAADLTSYAREHGLTDPVASGQYKAVDVEGGPSTSDDSTGGDIEVDLDQQSILSTAPTANQHAYFAPNTNAGFDEAFASVYDDVVRNSHATQPDPHITALSSSWGACESATGAESISALEPILKSLVGAGVTVFSAAGDDGIYDCRSISGTGTDNRQPDVDYPGSSPSVVSVGGSRLSAARSAPNTGTNWSETAWSCTSATSCQDQVSGTGGTGGGASGSAYSSSSNDSFPGFAAPIYQKVGIDDAPFTGATKRLVPDITADGDPSTGFTLYTSNPQYVVGSGGSNHLQVGGTSLASPISAALLDNALAESGRKTGVGDVHGPLYSAYAQTRSLARTSARRPFRDVTKGTNGAGADKGTDPSVSAQAGFDTVSGVGDVLWKALVPYLVDTDAPTVTASARTPKLHTYRGYRTVTGTWKVAQGSDSSLLGKTAVKIQATGAATPTYRYRGRAHSGSHSFTGTPGKTYVLTVTGHDVSGRSTTSTSSVPVLVDDRLFSHSTRWGRLNNNHDVAGSSIRTSTKAATAVVTTSGRSFTLRAHTGPSSGKLGVYLGNTLVKTLDLYTPAKHIGYLPFYASSGRAHRTFTFKALGTRSRRSAGRYVRLDAVHALP